MSSSLSLSQAHLHEFIAIYLQQQILYNPNHPDYTNREAKRQAYEVLVEHLKNTSSPEATIETVRAKLNSVRSSFRREFKKLSLELANEEQQPLRKPTLSFFELLLPTVVPRNEYERRVKEDFYEIFSDGTKVEEEQPQMEIESLAVDQTTRLQCLREMIEIFKASPSLWDVNHPDYINKKAKNVAYQQLVVKMQEIEPAADVNHVQRQLDSLKNSFRREYRKVEKDWTYEPTLWHYDLFATFFTCSGRRKKTIKCTAKQKCRCCLASFEKAASLVSLWPLADIYESCTGHRISKQDSLPTSVCLACEIKLRDFHSFRERCRQNEANHPPKPAKEKKPQKGPRRIACDECGRVVNFNNLLLHKETHREAAELLPCPDCGKNYATKRKLYCHRLFSHRRQHFYECRHCPRRFSYWTLRRRHELSEHLKVLPFICDICGRKFIERAALNLHMKRHLDKYIYCPGCKRKFVENYALRKHMEGCLVYRTKGEEDEMAEEDVATYIVTGDEYFVD